MISKKSELAVLLLAILPHLNNFDSLESRYAIQHWKEIEESNTVCPFLFSDKLTDDVETPVLTGASEPATHKIQLSSYERDKIVNQWFTIATSVSKRCTSVGNDTTKILNQPGTFANTVLHQCDSHTSEMACSLSCYVLLHQLSQLDLKNEAVDHILKEGKSVCGSPEVEIEEVEENTEGSDSRKGIALMSLLGMLLGVAI